MTENPFFEAWNTPFELPPFDRIRPEHFPPAFDRGMAKHAADIAAIAGSGEAADFANTVEALALYYNSDEAKEGTAAFLEKRRPNFRAKRSG